MCGRFTVFDTMDTIEDRFQISLEGLGYVPRYNIAPSQNILTVIGDEEGNRAGMLRWGLVPVWASDPKIGYKMINARAETVHQKPSYKRLLKRRRCIIPASGFFEWKKIDTRKQPYHIQLRSGKPFGFAGLWDRWEYEGEVIQSCTIITTTPNGLMKDIHDRMPVILTKENEEAWLDRTNEDPEYLRSLLQPYAADEMEAYEVSPAVGSSKNHGPELVEKLG